MDRPLNPNRATAEGWRLEARRLANHDATHYLTDPCAICEEVASLTASAYRAALEEGAEHFDALASTAFRRVAAYWRLAAKTLRALKEPK